MSVFYILFLRRTQFGTSMKKFLYKFATISSIPEEKPNYWYNDIAKAAITCNVSLLPLASTGNFVIFKIEKSEPWPFRPFECFDQFLCLLFDLASQPSSQLG
jgi:hypothetical protein